MEKNRYEAIICDLGNVLIDFNHRIAVKKILAYTSKKEEEIYSLFFDSPLTGLYEEGKISSDEFFQKVKDLLKLDLGYKKFLPIWDDIFFETPLNIKMQGFLKVVKASYKLIMISNLNELHFEFLKPRMDIFKKFDKLILSYEVGFRKPASEIYKIALESVEARPSSVFYIDDRKDLVEAASGLGIKGIVFDGEGSLEKIRKELGHNKT